MSEYVLVLVREETINCSLVFRELLLHVAEHGAIPLKAQHHVLQLIQRVLWNYKCDVQELSFNRIVYVLIYMKSSIKYATICKNRMCIFQIYLVYI